jgi:hypothetical protein
MNALLINAAFEYYVDGVQYQVYFINQGDGAYEAHVIRDKKTILIAKVMKSEPPVCKDALAVIEKCM